MHEPFKPEPSSNGKIQPVPVPALLHSHVKRCYSVCLEYYLQAWNLTLVRDKQLIEAVQRRFTKIVSGLRSTVYEEQLWILDLCAMGCRRGHGDLIETSKKLKRLSNTDGPL